jgi:hypothetical protein
MGRVKLLASEGSCPKKLWSLEMSRKVQIDANMEAPRLIEQATPMAPSASPTESLGQIRQEQLDVLLLLYN